MLCDLVQFNRFDLSSPRGSLQFSWQKWVNIRPALTTWTLFPTFYLLHATLNRPGS